MEILHEILRIVLKESLRASIERRTPIPGLRQYRALLRTCKFFKAIVDSGRFKLTLRCAQDLNRSHSGRFYKNTPILVSLWGNDNMSAAENSGIKFGCCALRAEKWDHAFMSLQILSIGHAPEPMTAKMGRFVCNPYIRLENMPVLNPILLGRLGHVFERTKRLATGVERNGIRLTQCLSHSRRDIVSVISGRNNAIVAYSIRSWKAINGTLSSLSMSARVKEWWILESTCSPPHYYPRYAFLVGYCDTGPLVVNVDRTWNVWQPTTETKRAWR